MAPGRSRTAWLTAVLALGLAGAVGFALGHSNRPPAFVVSMGVALASPSGGTAYLGANERINRAPTGFAYSLPPNVPWVDREGTLHEGSSRPSCLPYYHAERVKMEAVQFPIASGTQGTVLWVQC